MSEDKEIGPVHADEKLTMFLELEAAIRAASCRT
jgi:hypothetical protein